MTEKQKFFALQALVCEAFPYYAVDSTLKAGYESTLVRLQNVKQGKVISLPDLVALVHHSIPDFQIPAYLLPEEAQQAA